MILFGLVWAIVYCIIIIILYPTLITSYISVIVLFGTLFLYLKKEKSLYYSKLITKGLGFGTGYCIYIALYNCNPILQLVSYATIVILILASVFHSKERIEYQEKIKKSNFFSS